MPETFAVEAKFNWQTNATEVLANLAKGFREVLEQTDRLKHSFETFDTGGLRKIGSALKALREFNMPATALDSIREAASGMENVAANARRATAAAKEAAQAIKDIPAVRTPRVPSSPVSGGGGGATGAAGGRASHGNLFTNAAALYFDSQIASQAAGALMAPSYDLGKSRTQLLANNTAAQADAAIANAQDLQRAVRGTNVQGNIEVYRQLLALTQNPSEARGLMRSFLPAGVAMATFNPDAGTYDAQLEAVTKSAEFKGMLSKTNAKTGKPELNAAGASNLGNLLLAMQVVSKGAVGSDTFLKFLRSGGTAAANMSLSEVPYLIPVIQSLGAQRAGTGLQGLEQQFSSGKMSNAAVGMLQDMGILSKDPSKYRKLGMGMFMLKPGALNEKSFEEAVFQPREFLFNRLLPRVQAYDAKNYGKAYAGANEEQRRVMETATLQQLASRIPGGTFMGELLRNQVLSLRDSSALQKLNPEEIKRTMAGSPQVAVESFTGSLKNLMGVLGAKPFGDAIVVLNSFTAVLNGLSAAAVKHPKIAASASTGGIDLGIGLGLTTAAAGAGKLLPGMAGKSLSIAGKVAGRAFMGVAIAQVTAGILEGVASWADNHMRLLKDLDQKVFGTLHRFFYGSQGESAVHKEAFYTGQGTGTERLQPIHIALHMDGRVVAQQVTHHQIRTGRPGVLTGTNDPDFLESPLPAGMRAI